MNTMTDIAIMIAKHMPKKEIISEIKRAAADADDNRTPETEGHLLFLCTVFASKIAIDDTSEKVVKQALEYSRQGAAMLKKLDTDVN